MDASKEMPEQKKKKSGCLKKIALLFLIFFVLGLIGFTSHSIRYATNPDYAQQYDEQQAQREAERQVKREEEERRKAEEKRLSDVKKAEERQLAEEQKRQEKLETDNQNKIKHDFLVKAKEARIRAQERLRNGQSKANELYYSIPIIDVQDGDDEDIANAKTMYMGVRKTLLNEIENDKFRLPRFKNTMNFRRQQIIKEAIARLETACNIKGVSDTDRREFLWLLGICYAEIGRFGYPDIKPEQEHDNVYLDTAEKLLRESSKLDSFFGTYSLAFFVIDHSNRKKNGGNRNESWAEARKLMLSLLNKGFLPAYDRYFSHFMDPPYFENPKEWSVMLVPVDNDYPPAQSFMSSMLAMIALDLKGLSKDEYEEITGELKHWKLIAAENGYSEAQYSYASSLQSEAKYSEDVDKAREVEKEAVKWLRLASEQGNPKAQFELGKCYLEGKGVEKNQKTGISWISMAAKGEYSDALGYFKKNYPGMNAKQKDLLRPLLGSDHFLIRDGSTFDVYGKSEINSNLSIVYLKDANNDRCSLFIVEHFGSYYASTILLGTAEDPPWRIGQDISDWKQLQMLLESDSYEIWLYADYASKLFRVTPRDGHTAAFVIEPD